MFLFKDTLIYIVDLLTLNSQLIALYLMPEGKLSNRYVFSIRHITTFVYLQTLNNTLALHLEAILSREITKKKQKKCKKKHMA